MRARRAAGADLFVIVVRSGGGIVGRRLGELDLEQHVGRLVLGDLEGGDGTPELHPHGDVFERVLAQPLGAADHLAGQADRGDVERPRPGGAAAVRPAQQVGGGAVEVHLREPAGGVHGLQRPARKAGTVGRQA